MVEQDLREDMDEDRRRADALLTLKQLKIDNPEEMMQKLEGRYGIENTLTVIELAGSPNFMVQSELRSAMGTVPNTSMYDISSPQKILRVMAEVEPKLKPDKMAEIADIAVMHEGFVDWELNVGNVLKQKEQKNAEERYNKFKSAEGDMFNLIASIEGLPDQKNPLEAYWDEPGQAWTIGFGNTRHPDGRKVQKGDKITSEEQLRGYVYHELETDIFPYMAKYLDLSQMRQEEIVAVASMCYNCGPGILSTSTRDSGGRKVRGPSELAKAINEYVSNRNELSKSRVQSLMAEHCKAKGKVIKPLQYRRDFEWRIFAGDVSLECLDKIPVSSLYSVGAKRKKLPQDNNTLVQELMKTPGKTVSDTITWVFERAEQVNAPQVYHGRKKSNTGR